MNAIIVAFLLVFLATFSGGTNAFVGTDAPVATVVTTATDKIEIQARDDAQSQSKMAAVDRAEPLAKSPALAVPFGLNAVPVADGELLTNWSSVEADIRAESKILAQCRENIVRCPPAARTLLAIVAQGRAQTGRARIGVINLAIHPMSDLAQWGVEDRWTAPLATLTTGFGDCGGLRHREIRCAYAGWSCRRGRAVDVRDLARDGDHAVVAVRLDGDWIMLDNRWLALVDDREMRRIIPRFVLDHEGVKQFVPVTMPDALSIGAVRTYSCARADVC